MIDEKIQSAYLKILEEELVMATGCTEPIALAYGASVLRELMGELPTKIHAEISGNIIKNVKSVVVPNTGGLKGIEAAVAAGIVAGKPSKQLQCIAKVSVPQQVAIAEYLKNAEIKVECLDSTRLLDIEITGYSENHVAKIHIANHHTNLVGMEKDGQAVLELAISDSAEENLTDKSLLNVATILEFANTVDVELLRPMIQRQIDCNLAIAWEGLRGEWGANVGQILLRDFGDDTKIAAKAFAAAGSDARMSGCELPVVIVSGSGNQGMTASLPVIVYAQRMGCTEEQLFRALAVSDLITIHQKSGIGRLSAYCGAISAGCGAGAGIAYLCDGSFQAIAHTVVNALAILSGTICDGAKPSCAAKIASAVEAGIMGYRMYCNDREFKRGEGIVGSSVDETIANVGVLAKVGMKKTDRVILQIMTQ